MFRKLWDHIPLFLRPAIFISGLSDILSLWQSAAAKERGILVLVFAPMLVCLAGLFFSVVSFVLFVLPSFVLRLLGWGVLTALFGAGGHYCYERMTGRAVPRSGSSAYSERYEQTYTDVKFTENGPGAQAGESASASHREEVRQRWFERVRRKK